MCNFNLTLFGHDAYCRETTNDYTSTASDVTLKYDAADTFGITLKQTDCIYWHRPHRNHLATTAFTINNNNRRSGSRSTMNIALVPFHQPYRTRYQTPSWYVRGFKCQWWVRVGGRTDTLMLLRAPRVQLISTTHTQVGCSHERLRG